MKQELGNLMAEDPQQETINLLTYRLNAVTTELNAARAEIERLDVSGIHTCHDKCQRWTCVMRRELKAVTKQRDRLAEALRQIKSELGVPQPEYPAPVANAANIAVEALAAVEGKIEKPVNLIHNGVGIADMYSRDEFENAMKQTIQTSVSDEAAKQNTKNLS